MLSLALPEPADLVGTFRRFGAFGPVYEITGVVRELPGGDTLMEITLPESGEVTEYKYSKILEDPKEDSRRS